MVNENTIRIDRQVQLNGRPFKVEDVEVKDFWRTNYNYYLNQKSSGGSVSPIIGRYTDGNQFQIFKDGNWEDANFWDYAEEVEINGKKKKRPYFQLSKIWTVEFLQPEKLEYYDRETKSKETAEITKCEIVLSKSVSEKLEKQVKDPRNPADAKFQLVYDGNKAPAEMYSVEFVP